MQPYFFTKLYKYKQSELIHQKENFLTEIFAQCLRADLVFRGAFLTGIGVKTKGEHFICETQFHDKEYGRPDVYIEIDSSIEIIIECKIGASQEKTQLKRYSNLLKGNETSQKYLIYLTKHFEETGEFSNLRFLHLRWYDIYGFTRTSNHGLTLELANFLIDEKMSTKILFNNKTLNTLKEVQELISSMDDFLNFVKDSLKSSTKSKFTKIKRIEYGDYGIEGEYLEGKLWVGFCQYEDDEEIQLCVEYKPKMVVKAINKNKLILSGWVNNNENGTWFIKLAITEFFINSEFDSNKARDFIMIEVSRLNQNQSKKKIFQE